MSENITEFRPKVDAVIVQLIDGKPIVFIEMVDKENYPVLQELAQKVLKSL